MLLCAAYMHDLGYLSGLTGSGHEKRSHDLILENPERYFLDDFPLFGDGHPRVARAIALVCYGHAHETELPLSDLPHKFAEQTFEESILNLRKLAALLRLADEADDPYLRLSKPSPESVRSRTALVEVGDGTITWYRDQGVTSDPRPFIDLLEQKKQLLTSSLDYLSEIGAGRWHLVIHPDPTAPPFMAPAPVETFVLATISLWHMGLRLRVWMVLDANRRVRVLEPRTGCLVPRAGMDWLVPEGAAWPSRSGWTPVHFILVWALTPGSNIWGPIMLRQSPRGYFRTGK